MLLKSLPVSKSKKTFPGWARNFIVWATFFKHSSLFLKNREDKQMVNRQDNKFIAEVIFCTPSFYFLWNYVSVKQNLGCLLICFLRLTSRTRDSGSAQLHTRWWVVVIHALEEWGEDFSHMYNFDPRQLPLQQKLMQVFLEISISRWRNCV